MPSAPHHDEVEMTSLLAPIVQVCDAISGARPGARREIVEAYIKRLNDLEQLAMSYPGVTKTYAIQAGRELRVIVGADKIDARIAAETGINEFHFSARESIQSEMIFKNEAISMGGTVHINEYERNVTSVRRVKETIETLHKRI